MKSIDRQFKDSEIAFKASAPRRVKDALDCYAWRYGVTLTSANGERSMTFDYDASPSEHEEIDHGPAGAGSLRIGLNLLRYQVACLLLHAAQRVADSSDFDNWARAKGLPPQFIPDDRRASWEESYERELGLVFEFRQLLGDDLLAVWMTTTKFD